MLRKIVLTSAVRIFTLVAVLLQSVAAPSALRIGTAREISDKDYFNLEREMPKGQKPWLLIGEPGQVRLLSVTAFLPATTRTSELRRGPAIIAGLFRPPAWKLDAKDPCCQFWAQVAIEGRTFADIQDLSDPNRPFLVTGAFSDAELLSLVRVLRTSEEISRRLAGLTTQKLPIAAVLRGPRNAPANVVAAYLRVGDSRNSTAEITLRQEGAGWQIVSVAVGSS